jgi:N-acetylmuramoyl-L-alanine amidase
MELREKIQYGLQHNIGTYVALHTNAGDGEGTEIFCNLSRPASKQLAEIMLDHVGNLTPTEDRGVFDGGENLGEVMSPLVDNIPTCLIEIEFHDEAYKANWIVTHKPDISEAITAGIVEFINTYYN